MPEAGVRVLVFLKISSAARTSSSVMTQVRPNFVPGMIPALSRRLSQSTEGNGGTRSLMGRASGSLYVFTRKVKQSVQTNLGVSRCVLFARY